MKLFFSFLVMIFIVYATPIFTPEESIEINGTAKDMVLKNGHLVIATDMGHIEIYNIDKREKLEEISLPDVKDFMGDLIPARIMSTDMLNDQYLILSDSGKGGYSNLHIYRNNTLIQLLSAEDKEAIIKARFIDDTHVLLGFLSNEVALLNIESKKERYRVQLSESKFSDFALNEAKTTVVFSCESGVLNLVDVQSGKVVKNLEGQNVDNVYKVDFKSGMVSGAGQDQRGSLYEVSSGKGEYIKGTFLIYGTALSPSASKVAFAMDEKNDISVYDTLTKSKIALLKGQKSTLNVILFQDEKRLISASDDNTIMLWNLDKK